MPKSMYELLRPVIQGKDAMISEEDSTGRKEEVSEWVVLTKIILIA